MSLTPPSPFRSESPVSWYSTDHSISSDNPDSDDSSSTRLTLSPENIRTPNPNEPALRKLGFSAIAKLGRDLLWNLGSLFVLTHHHAAKWIPFTTNAVLQDPENPLAGILLQWPLLMTVQGNFALPQQQTCSSTWDVSVFNFRSTHHRWETLLQTKQLQYEPIGGSSTLKIYDHKDPTHCIRHFSSVASDATRIAETPLREQLLSSGFKQIGENVYLFIGRDTPTPNELLIALIEPQDPTNGDSNEHLVLLYPEDTEHALIMGGLRNHPTDASHLGLHDLSEQGTIQPTFQLQPDKKSKSLHLKSLMTPQIAPLSPRHYPLHTPTDDASKHPQPSHPNNAAPPTPTEKTPRYTFLPSVTDLGVSYLEPHSVEDQTFIIGGNNPLLFYESCNRATRLGSHSTGTHEHRMKKRLDTGDYLDQAWLGVNESLIKRLTADHKKVTSDLNLSHQTIGTLLEYFALTHENGYRDVEYGPYRFELVVIPLKNPSYPSPFSEKGMQFESELIIKRRNLKNSQEEPISITMCRLSPYLIRAWGFYGGKSCPWRIDPEEVVKMFSLNKYCGKRLMESIGLTDEIPSNPLICQTIVQYGGIRTLHIEEPG